MNKVLVFALLVSVAPVATARMYMCVDKATGATSFTDRACETEELREEIRVNPINPGSASTPPRVGQKTWRSQADNRKTGSDYKAQRRSLYENKATASTQ